MTQEMQCLEEENNRIFIEAYGLEDELTPEVPIEEITLTCNPHYRYGNKKTEEELEVLLLADTMKELISYAVGCMFGRYSLDKPGLILANQGETLRNYISKVDLPKEEITYLPDEDNVLPITEGEYFEDDIVTRFKQFLRVTFGNNHYEENLAFIENAIGKDIRKYFLSDFYKHHVRMYKKRPIYWLFTSPNKSFNALIYMHRYRPDTVSTVLNEYLRQFIRKLEAQKGNLGRRSEDPTLSVREKGQIKKEMEIISKILRELADYERDILFPLAAQRKEIDLDDGVKVNYAKFGKALAKI
jgi:type II restriction/modification system DNA methylase subunit YeeA